MLTCLQPCVEDRHQARSVFSTPSCELLGWSAIVPFTQTQITTNFIFKQISLKSFFFHIYIQFYLCSSMSYYRGNWGNMGLFLDIRDFLESCLNKNNCLVQINLYDTLGLQTHFRRYLQTSNNSIMAHITLSMGNIGHKFIGLYNTCNLSKI